MPWSSKQLLTRIVEAQKCADQSIQVMKVALSPDIGKIFQISHAETKATLSSKYVCRLPDKDKDSIFLSDSYADFFEIHFSSVHLQTERQGCLSLGES